MRVLFLGVFILSLCGCDQLSNKTTPQATQATATVAAKENPFRKAAEEEVKAIKLAKEARTLVADQVFTTQPDPETVANEFQIRVEMGKVKGVLKILGWEANKIDDDTYLVTYSYEHKSILPQVSRRIAPHTLSVKSGWPFEVKLSTEVVRYVIGDRELEEKYNWSTAKR